MLGSHCSVPSRAVPSTTDQAPGRQRAPEAKADMQKRLRNHTHKCKIMFYYFMRHNTTPQQSTRTGPKTTETDAISETLTQAANGTAANMQRVDQPDCRLKTFRSNSEQNAGCNYFPRLQACGVTKEANYKIYRDLN